MPAYIPPEKQNLKQESDYQHPPIPIKLPSKEKRILKPGDVIAFGGHSPLSGVIKGFTDSNVSHMGIVSQGGTPEEAKIAEAVEEGVVINQPLGEYLACGKYSGSDGYNGDIWWLPLNKESRNRFDKYKTKFRQFLDKVKGKEYSIWEAAKAGIFDKLGIQQDIDSQIYFFCSELVAGCLRETSVITKDINPSEIIPQTVCEWAIYKPYCAVPLNPPSPPIYPFNNIQVSPNIEGNVIIATEALNVEHALDIMHAV